MRTIIAVLVVSLNSIAADPVANELPAAWHGNWKGTLKVANVAAATSEVAMQIEIAPIADTKKYRWQITYGEAEKAKVRKYEIIPHDTEAGRFLLDEGNSIVLDMRLMNGVLYSQFEVEGNLLAARYELKDKAIHYEITTCRKAAETGGENGIPKVKIFPVTSVQTATLKKP